MRTPGRTCSARRLRVHRGAHPGFRQGRHLHPEIAMARLLFTVWPYPTHLHPFIAVARRLACTATRSLSIPAARRCRSWSEKDSATFPFREVDWGRVARTVDDLIAGRKRPSQMRRLWPRFLVETVPAQVRDLEAVFGEWPADALVCDIAMWAPILILRERCGIPVIRFVACSQLHSTWAGRSHAGDRLAAAAGGHPGAVGQHVLARATGHRSHAEAGQRSAPPIRPVAAAMSVNEFTGTLPLYLVPSAPEFDNHRRDLPPSGALRGSMPVGQAVQPNATRLAGCHPP